MLDAAFTQPLQDRALRVLALIPQRIMTKRPFSLFVGRAAARSDRLGRRARRKIPPADRSPYVP